MLPRIITKLVGWAVALFYHLERSGPRAPDGPLLVAANHPNSLIDPLVIFRTAGRPTRPLAKAPLFEQALVGTVLRGLGGLPVYRRQDDPELMHLNERTFDAAIEALVEGGAVQIYPEGRSHSDPSLAPLRTGAARIALMAEERSGWRLGVRIQPVGLTYVRKAAFRGRVIAAYGPPITVAEFREAYEADPQEAGRRLTAVIQAGLEELTLNFEDPDDQQLVDVAERIYSRQKRLARSREREPMAERLPRLHRFADGIRWLRATDPERFERLSEDLRRYMRLLTLLGATEGDVPREYRLGPVLWYALRQLMLLAVVLPLALVGLGVWFVPLRLSQWAVPRFRPELDQVATYKLATTLVGFPLWLVLLVTGSWLLAGLRTAVVVLVALPVTGLAAIAWRDRQETVREDVRVFLRARRLRRGRDRLADERARLVAEFDALLEEWAYDIDRTLGGA